MNQEKLQMQLQIIRVTYRAESRRLPADALHALRLRASEILDRLESEANGDVRVLDQIASLRKEIGADA